LVAVDDAGSIITDIVMSTSVPGIFAAGDIRKDSSRQVSTAVGDGATAAMSAFKYITERK
jgi:thioredoxin reductase (NADPH)